MNTFESLLPHYDFSERHAIIIRGQASDMLDAVAAFRVQNAPLVRQITRLRELPGRLMKYLSAKLLLVAPDLSVASVHQRWPHLNVYTHVFFDKNEPWYLFVCFLCVSCAYIPNAKKPPLWAAFFVRYQYVRFGCGGRQPTILAIGGPRDTPSRRVTE
ncbi:hypothetical protein [Novacetimonas cocois]|uniref:hypothetical protein n=1 Tax=Novacetimonas cocois TaxID=1747507 RepID=UPI001EEFBF89|nr:hypothetical protein [Novacetimonas cocois]